MTAATFFFREFFTPIINGYIWRVGLALLLFCGAWILRHNRKVAEQYANGLVMLGMLRPEEKTSPRPARKMGGLLYFLFVAALGWFGWYCYLVNTAKPAVEDNPLKDLKTTPTTPLSPDSFRTPLSPRKAGGRGNMGTGQGPRPSSPYAPMPR